ncbi:helix-turn-helix domain-containing protein [Peribacillus loiseleuriae]|uniref:DNA-binding protein n=1 Tax=Peribacillus loiseleuriae TaxID=1679170 RepID=A0A0K9GRH5_9BACI|nr:helix-turn-helix domain-containing protein [Peribacillus loiseleuriae]KMY49201.1 DNA-binding protein [Peribacillus loiseleuriae]
MRPLTVQNVAEYLGVHPDTIYTMVKQKQIPHFRVRRRILFSTEAINDWIKKQESQYELEVI